MEKESECPCHKIDCELRGGCVACFKLHARKGESIFCLLADNATPSPLEERMATKLKAAGIPLGCGIK